MENAIQLIRSNEQCTPTQVSLATIDASLDNGTTYEYVFEKKDDNYQLVSVKLMGFVDTTETPEE